MTNTATLLPDGGTRYETANYTDFAEALAAAHQEQARIEVRSEGKGTFVAHIYYPADADPPDDSVNDPQPVVEPPADTGGTPASPEPEEDLIGAAEPVAAEAKPTRTRSKA